MPDVKDGDCVASIADALGLSSAKALWDANKKLHPERPNPNQLVVGDSLEEPKEDKKKKKKVKKPVGSKYTVVLTPGQNKVSLRIVLLGADGKAINAADWQLTAPVAKSGKTGADGLIVVEDFPVAEKSAKLKVTPPPPPAPPAPPTPPTVSPPPYPAPVVAADFKDKRRAADASDAFVEWSLKVGSVPSFNHETGVVARLENLGAPTDSARRERAIKSYQKALMGNDAGSGKPKDIQVDIRNRHDLPSASP